jgi:NAD(P)H-dependent FMN reductase
MAKVIAVCGSLSARSVNRQLIAEIKTLAQDFFDVDLFEALGDLPHYNPDLDNDNPPVSVATFRKEIAASDGVIICTPEYAMGVPGALKNALDWLVSSMELSHKPVALITASLSGEQAHQSLIKTLKVIEADVDDNTSVLIPFIKAKMDSDGHLKDDQTRVQLIKLFGSFNAKMNSVKDELQK